MSATKQDVSWLESFPCDIWAYFAVYLPGEQLVRLMITGATILRRLLKSPTVVKSLEFGLDFMPFSSLPRFLNDFPSLEKLWLYGKNAMYRLKIGLTIDQIPSGVRKLVVVGHLNQTGDEFLSKNGPKLDECLPHLETLKLYWLTFSQYSWMAHSPQSLTRLSVSSWDGTVELPSALIHFEAHTVHLSTNSFVSKLPPTIDSFLVNSELDGADLIVPLLPTSTRKLSLGVGLLDLKGYPSTQLLLEQLPKSLTWFSAPIDLERNPELCPLLPSTLTFLDVAWVPCSAWPLLPRNLGTVYFSDAKNYSTCAEVLETTGNDDLAHGVVHHEVQSIPFHSLPRSILHLEFYQSEEEPHFCGLPKVPIPSYFPPKLKYLNVRDVHLSPETAKRLPSTLTYLETAHLSELVCEHLPNSIETLISYRTLMSPNLIKFLPKSLTDLHLCIARSEDSWFDEKTGKRIDSLSKVTECQDSLSHSFDWKDCSSLPHKLTSLILTDADDLGDTFMLQQQLPNLEMLFLKTSQISDISIPLLSRNLKTLDLGYSGKVSGKSFQYLPRGLIDLALSNSESIFDSDIQHLPRTLKIAYLGRAIHLTDLCIPDLPPHLERLDLESNTHITPSSFPHLPYTLRSSQFHESAEFASWKIAQGVICLK